jgi:hypothetical protein
MWWQPEGLKAYQERFLRTHEKAPERRHRFELVTKRGESKSTPLSEAQEERGERLLPNLPLPNLSHSESLSVRNVDRLWLWLCRCLFTSSLDSESNGSEEDSYLALRTSLLEEGIVPVAEARGKGVSVEVAITED